MKVAKIVWYLCIGCVVLMSVISFTPLIIPKHEFKPELFGLPYTLWTGMIIAIGFSVCILIGVKFHSKIHKEDKL